MSVVPRGISRSAAAALAIALWLLAVGCASDTPSGDAGAADGGDGGGALAPHCNPLDARYCLLPWPSSFYLASDATTATGFRVAYPELALPATKAGAHFDPARYNLLDGFSPAAQPIASFAGGVSADGLPGERDDYGASITPTSLVQIIEHGSGRRIALFAEIDHGALGEAAVKAGFLPGLLIHPAERLHANQRYIVVLRVGIKDAAGKLLEPPALFRRIRDGEVGDDPTERAASAAMGDALDFVAKQGVAREQILLAWDFHTASEQSLIGGVQAMVDDALARLPAGGPDFKIIKVDDKPEVELLRSISGEMTVPSYLASDDADATLSLDAAGTPRYRGQQTFSFHVHVPRCAETATSPLPLLVQGHGIFGSAQGEMDSDVQRHIVERLCMVQIGADWIGVTQADVGPVAAKLVESWSNLPRITDRLQQAQVNFAALVELAVGRLLDDPALQINGSKISDGSEIYYYGISNGGIQGAAFAALNKRIERVVLQVSGGPWSLLIQRSDGISALATLLRLRYPDPLDLATVIHVSQALFDAVDPVNYAPHLLRDPLAGRSVKRVLLQESKDDEALTNLATRVFARTAGLPLLTPAVESVYGLAEKPGPLQSAYAQWDTDPPVKPPLGNVAPKSSSPDNSAHDALRRTESCDLQLEAFLRPDGVIKHTCVGPCRKDNPAGS